MLNCIENFNEYKIIPTVKFDSDDHIGIPFEISVLFNNQMGKIESGYTGTPIAIYVINTATERIGTESDEVIIERLLRNGFVVTILDYLDNPLAAGQNLDTSVQLIRRRLMNGEFFENSKEFPKGNYPETLIVPSGYDVLYKKVFWSFDKHGSNGSLEKIVEIWNNDFRGTKGEVLIKWTDKDGKKKDTQVAFDKSAPIWYNEFGEESENGNYIKVKHTKANDINDCVKPDGSPIDLDLYMNIIYPTAPEKKVPVACLASSSEHLCTGSATKDRPHLNGFLFRGYAAVMFDYGYTPMARLDHYGYFDGFPAKGHITGDNPTYSMQFYDDKRINTAAMRFLRYTALSNTKIALDTDAIAVFGNSKGGHMSFLGEEHPTQIPSRRIHANHYGESRLEGGCGESYGSVRGAEEQPWLCFEGKELESTAKLIYASCGGAEDTVTKNHGPMFISCNRRDGSCYSISNTFVNVCKTYDIPAMWFDIPSGHTLAYGKDLKFGTDTYDAFFDFAGYYLKHDAVKLVCAVANENDYPFTFTLRFSGAVDKREIEKINVTSNTGENIDGEWNGAFGGVDWTFEPKKHLPSFEYKIVIPKNLCGKNGKPINSETVYTFNSPHAAITETSMVSHDSEIKLNFINEKLDEKKFVCFYSKNDGANTVSAFGADGNLISSVNVSKRGWHRIDVSNYLNKIKDGATTEITLKLTREVGITQIFGDNNFSEIKISDKALGEAVKISESKRDAIKIDGFKTITSFPTEEFYSSPMNAIKCASLIKQGALEYSDMGRKFHIEMKIFDTASRYLNIQLSNCTSRENSIADYRRSCYNIVTEAGKWSEIAFDYTVYEPMYGELGLIEKVLYINAGGFGNKKVPFYVSDLKVTESITELEIESAYILSERDKSGILPDGMSDIECPKAPWAKK